MTIMIWKLASILVPKTLLQRIFKTLYYIYVRKKSKSLPIFFEFDKHIPLCYKFVG